MEININELARKISKLTIEEIDELSNVLTNKYGIFSNIYLLEFICENFYLFIENLFVESILMKFLFVNNFIY